MEKLLLLCKLCGERGGKEDVAPCGAAWQMPALCRKELQMERKDDKI